MFLLHMYMLITQVPKFEFPRTPSFPKSFPYTTPTSLVAVNPLEVEILKPRKRSANLELSLGAARQLKAQVCRRAIIIK